MAGETRFDKLFGVGSGTGSRPAAGNAGARWIDITGPTEYYDDGSAWQVMGGGGGGGGALTDAVAHLSTDVSLGQNSMTDVLSLSLVAGTWLLIGKVLGTIGGSAAHITAELYDGSTHIDSGQQTQATAWQVVIPLFYKVTPGSTTTYKIRATSTGTGAVASAAAPNNGVGNNGTTLYALKYA